eukprot:scaffold78353_cov14-Tisochrysis_lutea.AAC.1
MDAEGARCEDMQECRQLCIQAVKSYPNAPSQSQGCRMILPLRRSWDAHFCFLVLCYFGGGVVWKPQG